jgi:hypothetical protein
MGGFGVEGAAGSSAEGPPHLVLRIFENPPGARARWAWGFPSRMAFEAPPPPPTQTYGGACGLGLGFGVSVPFIGYPTLPCHARLIEAK